MQSTFLKTFLIAFICVFAATSFSELNAQEQDQSAEQTESPEVDNDEDKDQKKDDGTTNLTITVPKKLTKEKIKLLEEGLSEGQIERLEKDKKDEEAAQKVLITNDAVIFGILMLILGVIFYTSKMEHPRIKLFYKIVPMLLLCYFLPSLLTYFRIVDPDLSSLYMVLHDIYFLPAWYC